MDFLKPDLQKNTLVLWPTHQSARWPVGQNRNSPPAPNIPTRLPEPIQRSAIMARATPSKAIDSPRDAIALLKQDHRTVEALFDEFEDADEPEQSRLAERICNMLNVHA